MPVRVSRGALVFSWSRHWCDTLVVERIRIIVSIVLVAALVFIVCALAFIVVTRVLPSARAKAGQGAAKDAGPADDPGKTG
jgi:hypothetical protein